MKKYCVSYGNAYGFVLVLLTTFRNFGASLNFWTKENGSTEDIRHLACCNTIITSYTSYFDVLFILQVLLPWL